MPRDHCDKCGKRKCKKDCKRDSSDSRDSSNSTDSSERHDLHVRKLDACKIKSKKIETEILCADKICGECIPSCRGPTGPTGPAGRNGTNGTNGTNGARGSTGPTGLQGPTGSSCEIVQDDSRVSVCDPSTIRGEATDHLLVTLPGEDPFDVGNTGGVDAQYFNMTIGAFRAGNFRESDLAFIGDQSAAFGYHTRASGQGAVAYGVNLADDTIEAGGTGSLAGGLTDATSDIISNGIAAVTIGRAEDHSSLHADSHASLVLGNVGPYPIGNAGSTGGSEIYVVGNPTNPAAGSIAAGWAFEHSKIFVDTDAQGSIAMGWAGTSGTISVNDGSVGSMALGGAINNSNVEVEVNNGGSVAIGFAINNSNIVVENASDSYALGFANIHSNIKAQINSAGAIATGWAQNFSTIQTGPNVGGSIASGFADIGVTGTTGGLIETGDNAHGSLALGYALGGIIRTGVGSYGSEAAGFAGFTGTIEIISSLWAGAKATGWSELNSLIQSEGDGAYAMGFAYNSGKIATGDNAEGSIANGDAENGGIIITGANAYGSHSHGAAINNAKIQTGSPSSNHNYGDHAGGYAHDGGIVQITDNVDGSFVHGIAGATGEVHTVETEGSASFGRNSKIAPSGETGASGANYSFAMGHNAFAYMLGSMAHSSFPGDTGYGENQFVRVLLRTTVAAGQGSTADLALGDGAFPTLPYPVGVTGEAIVNADIIGLSPGVVGGSSTNIIFQVNKDPSGAYTIVGTNADHPLGATYSYTPVSEGNNGFSVRITNSAGTTNPGRFIATFNITMLV